MKWFRYPSAGLLMGVWASLVASGCVVGIVDVDGNDGSWDKEATEVVNRTVPVTSQLGIRVLGQNGDVRVLGAGGVQDVSIRATKRVRSNSVSDAEAHLGNIQIRVTSTPTEVRVETVQPDPSGHRTYIVDYEITVPESFLVAGVIGNGNVILEDVRSDLEVQVGNGNAVFRRVVGSARVVVGNGNLDASMVLPEGGQIVSSVGNGTAILTVPTEVSARFKAQVGNGTIVLTGLDLKDPVSGPNILRGTLGSGAGLIDLTVGNGSIQARGQ
jgi:hypothetical protein